MSGSRITTEERVLLDNVHPGDILREDFLIGSEIPVHEVADGAQVDAAVLDAILAARRAVDASVDARLTRYFGVSEGYFLRLQNRFDLEEVTRNEAEALARIVRRAA